MFSTNPFFEKEIQGTGQNKGLQNLGVMARVRIGVSRVIAFRVWVSPTVPSSPAFVSTPPLQMQFRT